VLRVTWYKRTKQHIIVVHQTNSSLPLLDIVFQFLFQKHCLFKQRVWHLAASGHQNLFCSTEHSLPKVKHSVNFL